MRDYDEVKYDAGREMRRIQKNLKSQWRKQRKRQHILHGFMYCICLLLCSCFVMLYLYIVASQIPSCIYMREGREEQLSLTMPGKANIMPVGLQAKSNIPASEITIDLKRPFSMKPGSWKNYKMNILLFGFLPIKTVDIQVIQDKELIPMGIPIGIYIETEGIMVIGTGEFVGADGKQHCPAKNILKTGDYIVEINGTPVEDKQKLMRLIHDELGGMARVTYIRNGEKRIEEIKVIENEAGEGKIGVWIRDNAQGVGTMTFIDENGYYGALGHGIADVDTGEIVELGDGTLYETQIVAMKKGVVGEPGEMTGMIVYSDSKIMGNITENGARGIFGTANQKLMNSIDQAPLPIALRQDVHTGPAEILCTLDDETKSYRVEIIKIHPEHYGINRGIELKVLDQELLEKTGGIIMGMSGSPIVQDGKLIGAVTHVLVNDPTRGYGMNVL